MPNLILNAKNAVKNVNRPGRIQLKILSQDGSVGFSITYGIVKKYNGQIEVKSKVGEGTTIKATFLEVQIA